MRIYSLNPDSPSEKTSVLYALNRGYRFHLTGEDGTATVINPEGETYHVNNWQCDCPDALFQDGGSYTLADTDRHACKHILYLSQLYPCPKCKAGFMVLRKEAWKVYQCTTPGCYHMEAFCKVKSQRQQAYRLREQEADVEKVITLAEPPDADKSLAARAAEARHAIFAH